MAQHLNPDVTINGTFGQLYDWDGKWRTEIDEVEFQIAMDRERILMSGTRKVGHKLKSIEGTGTLRGFKVTSEWLDLVAEMMRDDRKKQRSFTLIAVLDDPEALGAERVLLRGVKIWEASGGFKADEIRREEVPFTFFDVELLDKITGDPSQPNYDHYTSFQNQ